MKFYLASILALAGSASAFTPAAKQPVQSEFAKCWQTRSGGDNAHLILKDAVKWWSAAGISARCAH